MKILAITWNTQSCQNTDITEWIGNRIKLDTPELICIAFQEDAKPGTSFHSMVLPKFLETKGYNLLKRARLMGIGKTTLKNYTMRGLRLSIYVTSTRYKEILDYEANIVYCHGNNTTMEQYKKYMDSSDKYEQENYSSKWHNKGAVAIYISHPIIGTICVINTHLYFDSNNICPKNIVDLTVSNKITFTQNLMFNNIYNQFVLFKDIYGNSATFNIPRPYPNHIICMGDLNYRVNPYLGKSLIYNIPKDSISIIDKLSESRFLDSLYEYCDELKNEMERKVIPFMCEGPNNSGPKFKPTAKMCKPRLIDQTKYANDVIPYKCSYNRYKPGKKHHRFPSWTDRILYLSKSMKCIEYDRFYIYGIMDNSDHDGVYGIYTLSV